MMMVCQLYSNDGKWIGQFANPLAVEKYLGDNELDANDYEIRMEPSKYPST